MRFVGATLVLLPRVGRDRRPPVGEHGEGPPARRSPGARDPDSPASRLPRSSRISTSALERLPRSAGAPAGPGSPQRTAGAAPSSWRRPAARPPASGSSTWPPSPSPARREIAPVTTDAHALDSHRPGHRDQRLHAARAPRSLAGLAPQDAAARPAGVHHGGGGAAREPCRSSDWGPIGSPRPRAGLRHGGAGPGRAPCSSPASRPTRPLWTGLGVVAAELMLLVSASFSVRRLIGVRALAAAALVHVRGFFALATARAPSGGDRRRPAVGAGGLPRRGRRRRGGDGATRSATATPLSPPPDRA